MVAEGVDVVAEEEALEALVVVVEVAEVGVVLAAVGVDVEADEVDLEVEEVAVDLADHREKRSSLMTKSLVFNLKWTLVSSFSELLDIPESIVI